jgi:hypothetical protein
MPSFSVVGTDETGTLTENACGWPSYLLTATCRQRRNVDKIDVDHREEAARARRVLELHAG